MATLVLDPVLNWFLLRDKSRGGGGGGGNMCVPTGKQVKSQPWGW